MTEAVAIESSATATTFVDRCRSAADRPLWWVSLGVIAAALAMRVWIIRSPIGSVNADEAMSGLMARALLDGDFSTFFWQQQYGGTIELVPFAALIAVLGDHAAITVLPLLETVVIGVLLYLTARRRIGGQYALATVALAAVFPAASVWFTTRAMLFYQPTMIAGLAAMLLAEQLAEDDSEESDADDSARDERGRRWRWAGIGLALGIGWWTSTQILFFAIPVGVWLVLRRGVRSWHGPVIALGAAAVGASPWLLHNLRTSGGSLRELPGGPGSYADHLRTQLEVGWPMSAGLRRPFDERWIVDGRGVMLAAVGVVAAVAVAAAFVRTRHIRSPLVLVLLTFPLVHAMAPSSYYVGTGRYYLYIMPSIAYAIVAALSSVRHAGRWVAAALVAATGLTTWTLHELREVRPGPVSMEALSAALTDRGIAHVYGDYWTGYMLTWENSAILSSPNIYDRRPDWSAEIRAAPDVAYIFDLSSVAEQVRHDDIVGRLDAAAAIAETFDVGPFRVVVPRTNVPPELLPAVESTG